MAEQEEDEFGAFLKTQDTSISTSKDIDEKRSEDDSEEDEFAQFLKGSEDLKKAPATLTTEKTEEEPVVAQNNQDALPLEAPIAKEEQAHSLLSALPSQESGLDSQLSADNQIEQTEVPVGVPSPFRNVKEERLEMERQLSEAKAKQEEDPLSIKEGTEQYAELEAAMAPKMNTEKDIQAFFNEVDSDQNIPEQHKEAARIIGIAKKDELLERFENGKKEEQEKLFKGEVENVQREAGDDVTQYINREKTATVNSGYVSDEVVKEYKLNKKISDLTSKNAISTALISATIPHNAYVKLAAINKSENKAEELAAYKQDLLGQIERDNKLLGNNISEEEFKSISERGVEYVSAVASSLAEISDKVNVIQGEKDEFLNEKHKGIDEEIATLKTSLIEKLNSEEGLSDDDRDYMQGLIKKQENLKNSFFEKDGAKTADLIVDDVKEGSNSYNLYREILKDIPKDLPSKEKFDLFYIAMKRISQRSLKEADMLDESGNYDAKIENVLRDFIGVENVLGVELPEAVGGLSSMEKEALEMKGKVDDLSNIFLNNTAYSSENYWDELYGSLMGGLFPETAKASGLLSDTAEAGETIATLSDYGITEGEGVNKEALEAFSDLVATPEKGLSAQKIGSTLGGSFAMMAKLMIGTSVLKIGKAGKLGKALDKAEKFLGKSKLGKLISSSLQQGANAEFSGQLFDDKEELEFKQFFAGQMASDVIEGMLKGVGGKFAGSLMKLGVNKKAALDFTGKVYSRAMGEITEESMQSIVGAYNSSDSFKGTIAELKKQFPDMSSVTEFAILTGLMGATFGLKSSYTDVRKRLKDGGYNTDAADKIMEEIGKETKKVGEIINEGKEGAEGHMTKVTDKKSPIKGGDTFTVGEDSYQISKIDKDFNVHVTVNGEEKVLSKEELSKLRKDSSFELFREAKAPVEDTRTTEEKADQKIEDDETILKIQKAREDLGVSVIDDLFDDVPESVDRVMHRVENGIPADANAVKSASDVLYKKYQEIEALKKSDSKILTDAQIDGILEQLGNEITVLENYSLENHGEQDGQQEESNKEKITKSKEQVEVIPAAETGAVAETDVVAEPVVEVEESVVTEPTAKVEEEVVAEPVAKPAAFAEVINDDSGEPAYTDIDGKFLFEKEVLKMTPEQLSYVTAKNPSEAVQALVAPVAETAGEASKAETVTEEVINDEEIVKGRTEEEVEKGVISFYHGGMSEGSTIDDVDLERKASKQQKKGRNYVGFYMNNSDSKSDSEGYAKGGVEEGSVHKIEMEEDAKVADIGGNIERVTKETLKEYKDQGYDVLKGKNVWGRTEYVLLNKDKVKSFSKQDTKTETAGETKTEAEKVKETKAEAKKAKAAKKVEVAKKAEEINNRLVSNVKEYNEMSAAKKKGKAGQKLLAAIQSSSGEQGNTISQDKGKIVVTDSKGKKIKNKNEFAPKADANEFVDQEVSSEDEAWAVGEVNSGVLDGDAAGGRIHLKGLRSTGLSAKEIEAGVKQIKKKNLNAVSAKRVIAALADARKKDIYEVSDGKGGLTGVPISEVSTRELTEEEVLSKEEIDAEMESKAEEQTKAEQILDARDSFVEAVRKLKIPPPGSFQTGGPLEIYNGAIELMAKAIYAGGSTAAAVSKAIAAIKASDWYKKKLPAEKKKIKAEAEADLIKRAEEINELAKIEKAKVEGTKKEAREAKSKEKKQRRKSQEQSIKEEAKERLGNDKNASAKKVRQHLITLLDNPYLSKEVKDRIRKDPDNMYDPQTNAWQSNEAVQLVEAFSEIEGGLEVLLEDVQEDFLKYGAVGAFILDAITVKYIKDGRQKDATNVANAKIKVGTVIGQILQSFGKILPKELKESLMGTHISIAADIREDIRRQRDAKIKAKREKGKAASKETVTEVNSELNESLEDVTESDAFEDAVKKGVAKYVKEQEAKEKAAEKQSEKKGGFAKKKSIERKKRKKLKEEYKKKNIFYSAPLLTKDGIEYAGSVAASYVRTGMVTAAQVANALRQYFKKEHGVDISDSDIVKIFDEINLNDEIEGSKDETSQKLAEKILNEVSKKDGKKTGDAVELLIRNLFAKAKDSLPKRGENETNASYRAKLIEAMQEQEFAKETWESAQNTIMDILDNAVATGKITGGEKGKILNDLEEFFGDKVGMPFSKKLLGQSLKEQIKSDGEKIQDIAKEHYSNREERGRSLAEKIVADTGLDPAKADELAAALEKQFSEMIKPYAERALAKMLGVENLSGEALAKVMKKKANQVTLENIIQAINLGALTEDSLVDAFSERFGFAKVTDADVQMINAFIYDISLLPAKSVARDKTFIAFRTYMKGLTKNNQGILERYYQGVVGSFFYQHILGNTPTVLRSVYGLLWGGGLQLATEFFKNPRLFLNGLRTMFSNPTQSMSEHKDGFRVMGAILKGIKNLGPEIIKDAWNEGYIPYESALEGVGDANTVLGVLDQLSNAEWKDISTAKKVAKLFETVPSKMLRMLMASDAVAHYAVRKGHVVTSVYNKILREGAYSSPTEKGFWEEVDKRSGNTDAVREMAEAQAAEELAKLQAAGVDTKNFREKQRVEEIIFESLEEDVKIEAEQKSMEMRLGHHPKGSFGLVYAKISPWINKFPGLMFILPFLKIPLNLADAATDYVPLLGLKKAVFGRGNLVKGLNRIAPNLVSDKLVEKTQSGKEFIAENRMDYLIKQGIGTAAMGVLVYAVSSTFDLEDDDPEKRIEVTYKGTDDYADNKQLRDNKGLQQYHFRFKYPGTNTWSGWVDYRDSPLGMIFAFAGGMSDKLKYDRDYVGGDLQEGELEDAAWTGVLNMAFFFKEQNFLQAIGDVVDVIQDEKLAGSKGKRFVADNIVRPLKGVAFPSVYTTAYSYKKALAGEFKKNNVKVKDEFWGHIADRLQQDVFFLDHMKEDYRDNLGQKVRTDNKIPFTPDKLILSFQDIFGISTDKDNVWNWLTSEGKFSKSDIATDITAGREMFFADKDGEPTKTQVPLEVRKSFKLEYDMKVLDSFNEEFKGSEGAKWMNTLKAEPEEYKKHLRKLRLKVKEDMMKNEWSHITFSD